MGQEHDDYAESGPIRRVVQLRTVALVLAVLTALAVVGWATNTIRTAPIEPYPLAG
jgi:hypothetical protein